MNTELEIKSGMEDLATLSPIEQVVTCRGEKITVCELELDQILDMLPLLQDMMPSADELRQMSAGAESDSSGGTEIKISVADLLRTRRKKVYQVIALAVGKDVDWVGHLPGSQAFELANALFEVNADFIASHAIPAVLGVVQMLGMPLAGMTSLPNSAPPDTQTP